MGSVTIRDLIEVDDIEEVICGDIAIERARKLATRLGSDKLTVQKVDVRDKDELRRVMRNVDVVANATYYELNLHVMTAAIEVGIDYADLGGLYYMTLKQLEYDEEAREVGITAILGIGEDPGISNIMARHSANTLDRVDEIHIRDGELTLAPIMFKYSVPTILDEYTLEPVVFRHGRYEKVPPLSGEEVFNFPEPVGKRKCYYALHSEIATLPKFIEGVKEVDFKVALDENFVKMMKMLNELGLTSKEPIDVKGVKISPRDLLLALTSSIPSEIEAVKDYTSIVVITRGDKDGVPAEVACYFVCKNYEPWGVSATAYSTGIPLSIASQMLAKDEIKEVGVLPPETCIEPKMFMAKLAKRGIVIKRRIVKEEQE